MAKGEWAMRTLTDNEIKALIVLLGDDDIKTATVARRALLEARQQARPFLEASRDDTDPHVRTRVYGILETLRLDELGERFHNFAALPSAWLDLEEGAYLIAESAYPNLNRTHYSGILNQMADELRSRLDPMPRGRELVERLNDYLFGELGFRGNEEHYYDPDNCYINRVLDRRLGLPISLAGVYLLVARRLRIPVVGIGMPGHFLLQFNDTLFIDAFHEGRILNRAECVQFLMNNGFGYNPAYLSPTPTRFMLVRMLTGLIQVYSHADRERADSLTGFRDALFRNYARV
jgi:regulator of sirC expression with transglutaminase-like and TPR domain